MRVIGNRRVHLFNDIDECPHSPGSEEQWQESWVLYLWDTQKQVYVFLRMSHEPNRGSGFTTAWLSASAPGYVYNRGENSLVFSREDRTESSLRAGTLCRYEYDGEESSDRTACSCPANSSYC